jgi:tRNA uridine 5-carbamoylmethylation protein Kti12
MSKFVLILRGPSSIGKTTIANLLKKCIQKKLVIIERDDIRHFIVNYSVKSKSEFDLSNKNLCDLTNNFLNKNYFVIVTGVFNSINHIKDLEKIATNNNSNILCVTLHAPLEIIIKRYKNRLQNIPFGIDGVRHIHKKFKLKKFPGILVDGTKSKKQILENILENIPKNTY